MPLDFQNTLSGFKQLSSADVARLNAKRQRIKEQYVDKGDHKIDWHEFADIVENLAKEAPDDTQFRSDLWQLFGEEKGSITLNPYLDKQNKGLPLALHNSGEHAEQMHHYLGGVTGKSTFRPTHWLNTGLATRLFEYFESVIRGTHVNKGDIRLFDASRPHRRDYMFGGRETVANNIRKLLEPTPDQVATNP